ncbi:MAG: FAD-dependent oxidoreductase [Firmicutes bacterium]|nr:FAD-dependent oxidoreductase [Bacillota bacterium]
MVLKEEFIAEAKRCLNCKHKPCVEACPAHNPIPEFMKKIQIEDFEGARDLWHTTSNLPEICGILCPHESLCEGHCTLEKLNKPLRIGWLEKEIALLFKDKVDIPLRKINHRHLVIGLGPAGIANALKMAEYGYIVDAIDADDSLGGAIYKFVPDFRFNQTILKNYMTRFKELQINVQYNTMVGKDIFLEDLMKQYDSIFISAGLDLPFEVDIEQEDVRIYYAIELLNKELYQYEDLKNGLGHKIGIIGLGDVAVDMARTLARLEKEVHIIYRRTLEEAPATRKEVLQAISEGVMIHELFGPISFKKGPQTKILDCDKTCLIKDLKSNRSKVVVLPNEKVQFELDELIFATGQMSSDTVFRGSKLLLDPLKGPYFTNYENIFVGGDRVNEFKRIVDAMVSGLEVAKIIKGDS